MERLRNERIGARGGNGARRAAGAPTEGMAGGGVDAAGDGGSDGGGGDSGLRHRGGSAQQSDGGAAAPLREEDIAQLQAICARGRIDVIAALQRTNGNMEAAANWLLSHD